MQCIQSNLSSELEKGSITEIIEGLKQRREATTVLVAERAKIGKAAQFTPVIHVLNLAETVAANRSCTQSRRKG